MMPYQQHITASVVMPILLAIFITGCRQENPPSGPGDTTELPPTGMPDWSDPRYDWIDSWDSTCYEYQIMRDFWYPKFGFSVSDISPDGTTLLLRRAGELLLFDIEAGSLRSVFRGSVENAAWSNNERYIACVRFPHGEPVIIDLLEEKWYDLPYPDSLGLLSAGVKWLPDDSSIVIVAAGSSPQVPNGHFAIGIHPPFRVERLAVPQTSAYIFNRQHGYYLGASRNDGTGLYAVELRIGKIGDTVNLERYALPGVTGFYHSRISADGNWLAFHMRADMRGTRFERYLRHYDDIHALGVIDLRPASQTQHELFRVFPDYTENYRNCAEGYFNSAGAISPDGRYIYHERIRRSDSTTQLVRLNIMSGQTEEISNFLTMP